ncbi:hypothetical protein HYW59_03750 [Candidatus Kaiserbacteria bacterium]|nr:hypothetical protein [Candidatus Kaiserbacteria bacterium]
MVKRLPKVPQLQLLADFYKDIRNDKRLGEIAEQSIRCVVEGGAKRYMGLSEEKLELVRQYTIKHRVYLTGLS